MIRTLLRSLCFYRPKFRGVTDFLHFVRAIQQNRLVSCDVDKEPRALPPSDLPRLSIVCVSYKRYKEIHVLINSILSQTCGAWELIVIHDGPDENMRHLAETYVRSDARIRYFETKDRFNDFGHSLRDWGMTLANGDYLLITNDDNYYAPTFVEYMLRAACQDELDFVLCDMVHNHRFPGRYRSLPYEVFVSVPRKHFIDIGNFIVKSSIAQKTGFKGRDFDADGDFVDAIIRQNPRLRLGKVHKILYVHN